MPTLEVLDERRVQTDAATTAAAPAGDYCRPDWTAELRRIEALILAGVTWS